MAATDVEIARLPATVELKRPARSLWGDAQVAQRIGATDAQQRLEEELARGVEHGVQYWPMFLRDTREHVGCCGLRPRAAQTYELGFHLLPAG